MTTKTCIRCRNGLPLSAFGMNRASKDGLHYYCTACIKVMNHERAGKRGPNPGTHDSEMPDMVRAQHIIDQDGKCALCGLAPKRFAADHNHSTGEFRAMLCYSCNLRLGKMERDLDWFLGALRYIGAAPGN